MSDLGRSLIILGVLIALVGLVVTFVGRVPGLGRLPGDIAIERGNWSLYFPLATSLLLSLVLSLVLYLIARR